MQTWTFFCPLVYISHEGGAIKDGRLSLDSGSAKKTSRHSFFCFIPSKSLLLQWLFNLPLVAQWINFCLMSAVSVLSQEFADYTSPFCIKCIPQIKIKIIHLDLMVKSIILSNKSSSISQRWPSDCIIFHVCPRFFKPTTYGTDLMQRHTRIRVRGVQVPSTTLLARYKL